MTKRLFLFNFRQTLSDGLNKNVPSSVILSRLYGAHANCISQCSPSGNLGTLLASVALRLRRCIQLIRWCNVADD